MLFLLVKCLVDLMHLLLVIMLVLVGWLGKGNGNDITDLPGGKGGSLNSSNRPLLSAKWNKLIIPITEY